MKTEMKCFHMLVLSITHFLVQGTRLAALSHKASHALPIWGDDGVAGSHPHAVLQLTRPGCLPLQVNIFVECRIVQDMLKGDDCHELRMKLKEHRDEKFPYKEDE